MGILWGGVIVWAQAQVSLYDTEGITQTGLLSYSLNKTGGASFLFCVFNFPCTGDHFYFIVVGYYKEYISQFCDL